MTKSNSNKRLQAPQSARRVAPAPQAQLATLPPAFRCVGFGEPAPFFVAECDINPSFSFSTVAGRWMVVAFLGAEDRPASRQLMERVLARRDVFTDGTAAFAAITVEPTPGRRTADNLIYFADRDLSIASAFRVKDDQAGHAPVVFLLDRALRVAGVEPLANIDAVLDALERLIEMERPELAEASAPVLTIPRIFERGFCQQLIDYYRSVGGETSGFMREVDGSTVLLHDVNHKRRRDVTIEDAGLRTAVKARIERRLLPMIERAFGWQATQMERYLIACYADQEAGFFRPHRDNTTSGTAHRKWAVSINLNADYDGGLLRFPEFGQRTYKPPVGGATVFNCSLLHEATPVTRGERFVFVPFLYDGAGAELRAANLHKVKLNPDAAEG